MRVTGWLRWPEWQVRWLSPCNGKVTVSVQFAHMAANSDSPVVGRDILGQGVSVARILVERLHIRVL